MASVIDVFFLSVIMGLSIFLSLPIIFHKRSGERTKRIINSVAIGILIFLIADIFADASGTLYGPAGYGYLANPYYSAVFIISLLVGFFVLYTFENRHPGGLSKHDTAKMISVGMGLQNAMEGLVCGALAATTGILYSGITLVILIGFTLQNATEGFPIAAPFVGEGDAKIGTVAVLMLVASLPTIFGAVVGFYSSYPSLNLFFEGLAIGAILYIIIPMIRHQVRDIDNQKQKLVYLGIFVGFVIGIAVNML